MASGSMETLILPVATVLDGRGMSQNQAQARNPHDQDTLACQSQRSTSNLKISRTPVRPP